MALPNIQTAQYGDQTSLQKLGASRRTQNPAADVNLMKDMVGGRPAETDPVKLALRTFARPQQAQQQQDAENSRYQSLFGALGVEYAYALKWIKLAARPDAGPVTKEYAKAALASFAKALAETRGGTPFFDEI